MTVATARSGALAAVDEVLANLQVRQSFTSFFVNQSADLFAYANDKPHIKNQIVDLLKLKSADPSVVYRGLILQLNGEFEGFIRALVAAFVAEVNGRRARFSDVTERLQEAYSYHAGKTLSRIFDGQINGVGYNFGSLQKSLGECYSDASPYVIDGQVFTHLMGICTPDRVERVFSQVGLPPPFSLDFGRHKAVRSWTGEQGAGRAASAMRSELERQLDVRNEIVHGATAKVMVPNDVERGSAFFSALVEAFCDAADGAVAAL